MLIFRHVLAVLAAGMIVACITAFPAPAAPPPLSLYGQLPGFEMTAISASGDHVAIVATVDGVRRLVVIDAAKKPVASAKMGNVKVRAIEWAGDQFVLIHAGKAVELVTLPGEDHWLSSGDTRLAMLQATVDFVMKYNPPDPAK